MPHETIMSAARVRVHEAALTQWAVEGRVTYAGMMTRTGYTYYSIRAHVRKLRDMGRFPREITIDRGAGVRPTQHDRRGTPGSPAHNDARFRADDEVLAEIRARQDREPPTPPPVDLKQKCRGYYLDWRAAKKRQDATKKEVTP